ncbi:hypothetical protein DM01DRAFT_1410728 [Hesseltinella vesiculosa]|uniref:LYR motif-containing protein Cup1-like N-terminal domain-containing protein n=1 Tax=Hesseltinella vesiculosa TaxID=101127 RepID=A0A1X2G645_9FUNG|nr:hypothetical protein DM01DRAFT_1410728 [Hesseltinella vesiculosa]
MFRPTPEHSLYIRALYKRVLSEASLFFDDRARTFMVNRARRTFREYKDCKDEQRIKNKLHEARKRLHRIERANELDQKSVFKILMAAYGRTGKVKHRLLYPYLYEHYPVDLPVPEPFVPHVPHTTPPRQLCGPLKALVEQDMYKKIEPELPEPQFKPLHPGRKANLLWRWRSFLIEHMEPPLPMEIVNELETKAGASKDDPLTAKQMQKGGPEWMYLYDRYGIDPDLMHLRPVPELVPRAKMSRRLPLPPSPFAKPLGAFEASTFLDNLCDYQGSLQLDDNGIDQSHNHPGAVPAIPERRLRRFYQRLLSKVALISPLPEANTLYDPSISYTISRSTWQTGTPTRTVLDPHSMPPGYKDSPQKRGKKKKK